MLTDLLIIIGVSIGLTALLDIFLSEKQKAAALDFTLILWSSLDDLKRFSLLPYLRKRSVQYTLIAAVFVIPIVLLVALSYLSNGSPPDVEVSDHAPEFSP